MEGRIRARTTWSKRLFIAVGVVAALAILLTILFSSPDDKPSTIKQWSVQKPADFVTTATDASSGGTSGTAEYGPPYNHNARRPARAVPAPAEMAGCRHPIDTEKDFVVGPLESDPERPRTESRGRDVQGRAGKDEKGMDRKLRASGLEETGLPKKKRSRRARPVTSPDVRQPTATRARSGDDGKPPGARPERRRRRQLLNASNQFFQTDYTKPLLFMADGGLLEERAHEQHLLGAQWGMMNETGSYPGQVWLWLYSFWYQIEPFTTSQSENADILVMMIMGVLSLIFICIPFIPGAPHDPALDPDLQADLARALRGSSSSPLTQPPRGAVGLSSAERSPAGVIPLAAGGRFRARPPRGSGGDKAAFEGVADELGPRRHAQLLLDVRAVGLDRAHAQVELAGDLGVGVAERDQPQHVELAL